MSNIKKNTSFKINKTTMDNGLTVVVAEIHKAPVVAVNITYKVGSKDENPNHTGLAHLFEHLMFEGTKTIKKGEFDKYCSQAGGTNNAYTSYDQTTYYMTLPSNQLELALWLESDRLFYFNVSIEALEIQKKVVSEEISQTVEEQPYGKWRNYLAKNAYSSKSCYSWEVHGLKEHVIKTTQNDIQSFHNKFYNPSNACLVVVGDIKRKDTTKIIEKYFSEITISKKNKRVELNSKNILNNNEITFEDNVPAAAVFQAFHCSGFLNNDVYKAEMICYLLGVGRSSRLYKELVNNKQIASQVGAFLDRRELDSLITVYAIASNENIKTEDLNFEINNIIKKIIDKGFSKIEIEKIRNKLSMQIARELQQYSGIADNIAHFTLFNNSPQQIFELSNIYSKFSLEEINDYMKSVLNLNQSITINAIPKKANN